MAAATLDEFLYQHVYENLTTNANLRMADLHANELTGWAKTKCLLAKI